jgi:ketosteroid isomerase-like protein
MAQDTQKLPAEIVSIIDTVFKAYSGKDFALLKSAYADNDLVIVDGFGRYRWVGPNALSEWWAAVEVFFEEFGVMSEYLANEGIRAWGVSGDRAYASISATLTIKLKKGEPIARPGLLTFTFGKQGQAWKAEGHAWGRLS